MAQNSSFRWSPKKNKAAMSLAEGMTREEAAKDAGVATRTIYRWLDIPEFSEEVDRLTLMTGISIKAERLRIAKRVVAGRMLTSIPVSKADLLDWLKFGQSETDGIKLDLANLLAAINAPAIDPLADSGSDGSGSNGD